nr:MAG TPA: hypothetical protein [Caudoviricetes sp.]
MGYRESAEENVRIRPLYDCNTSNGYNSGRWETYGW